MKTRVAMLFGGKSVEHEVSVISGIQAVMNMDTDKYEVIPVYMTKRNEMYIGEEIGKIESYKNIDELLKKSQRVIMTNEDGKVTEGYEDADRDRWTLTVKVVPDTEACTPEIFVPVLSSLSKLSRSSRALT